ncbi:MAG: LPS assembly lipoprotein LptE [Phycisphaerae bacterium]|nr:LPS assembly lipoprotein LptE [Tepidisphaeraceae bacterium]
MNRGLAIVLLASCVTGCGYQTVGSYDPKPTGYRWASLYREDVRTVAVPVFTNRDFRRGVEIKLTEAVVKQIEAKTPYRVATKDKADTVLEADITSIDVPTLTRDVRTNLPQEQLYTINMNLRWKDLRTGKMLAERRNFQQTAPYYSTLGEGSAFGSQQAVERLALAIVQEMQADW